MANRSLAAVFGGRDDHELAERARRASLIDKDVSPPRFRGFCSRKPWPLYSGLPSSVMTEMATHAESDFMASRIARPVGDRDWPRLLSP